NVERIIETSEVDTQRIRLLGRVDVSSVYSVLRDCHALVLLSDYEGLPVSMLEAMAAGVVPVCLDTRSGIRDAIQHGFNGLIVKDRKDDFHGAVRTLKKDVSCGLNYPPMLARQLSKDFQKKLVLPCGLNC